jgi:hypothetical protein
MKPSKLFTVGIFQFLISSVCFAQLVVDAGTDTAVCNDTPNPLSIGGNPTAKGGAPPYQYTWSGSYSYSGRVYSASFMLEDTTVANPVFREGAIPDSVVLFVTAKDTNEDVANDSILVRQSSYTSCLGECLYNINEGDSVQLEHCVTGGIPPLQFLWTPIENLFDTTIQNPWARPSVTTTYLLQIKDSIGCQTTSICKVFVNSAGYDYLFSIANIEVYPNPSSKTLHVKFNQNDLSQSTFQLISVLGITVYETRVYESEVLIDLQDIAPGTYIYYWSSKDIHLASGQIIVE